MEETEPYIIKPKVLDSQVHPNQTNPNKFYTHFMYKAIIVAIFLVVLPLLPSQAPEFINQTLQTRSWELVQVLLVGIAVSYGLFSRKNDETEKEQTSKFDNAHSYVSRILQVSSVFDDETDIPNGSAENNKVETWNSQYYRGEPPMVVVNQENSVLEEQRGCASRVVEKPLLLPVRSLKSRVSHSDVSESIVESSVKGGSSLSSSNSNSSSKRFSNNSNKSRNGDFGGSSHLDLEKRVEENVVLRSPIPWKSRSGRMEIKEELIDGVPLYALPPSMEETEFHRLESRASKPQTSRSSRPNSTSPSPNKLSPSPSFSLESHSKNVEEVARKKIYYQSSPPPAPPPPPPPPLYFHKPPLVKSNSSFYNSNISSGKELKRSIRSLPKDLSGNDRVEMQSRGNSGEESRPRVLSDGSLVGKSVRTIRSSGESFSTRMKVCEFGDDNQEFVDTDQDTESEEEEEEDVFEGGSKNKEVVSNSVGDGGPDVNKKADEFIAKFREQIRLQRIESIKKSTGQVARNTSR